MDQGVRRLIGRRLLTPWEGEALSFKMHTHSIATASWNDKRTGLPEVDEHPSLCRVDRTFITGRRGFRFSHLLEVFVNVDDKSRLITGHGFTAASGIYRGPSCGGFPSEYYEPIRSVRVGQDPVFFNQIIGAHTESRRVRQHVWSAWARGGSRHHQSEDLMNSSQPTGPWQ